MSHMYTYVVNLIACTRQPTQIGMEHLVSEDLEPTTTRTYQPCQNLWFEHHGFLKTNRHAQIEQRAL